MAAVSPKELRQLVNRLEAEAVSRPWLYKARVVALALLGYGYLLLILALSVGLPLVLVLGLFTGARAVFIQLVLKLGIPAPRSGSGARAVALGPDPGACRDTASQGASSGSVRDGASSEPRSTCAPSSGGDTRRELQRERRSDFTPRRTRLTCASIRRCRSARRARSPTSKSPSLEHGRISSRSSTDTPRKRSCGTSRANTVRRRREDETPPSSFSSSIGRAAPAGRRSSARSAPRSGRNSISRCGTSRCCSLSCARSSGFTSTRSPRRR
jgi:hypothetical protein